ncbi:uncharacterized protein PAE49_008818 isoform 2-T2 [Odontesthes bonariensis]|uniref:uncharacterized protein LOC142385288 isoform X2 n=1 Tax=Odontesthes bonariensis TaxID=219752 RepID=UPI003F580BB1
MEVMEHQDHAYTNATFHKANPMEFTYKMSRKEVEDFVKLRISNNNLFSGRRNTSKWAWRAILKHMGFQQKMTHCQASKKWENMKNRYKELKNPQDGKKVFPELWPYFSLMDDAMEGRLQASGPEIELTLNGVHDGEEVAWLDGSEEITQEVEGKNIGKDSEPQLTEREQLLMQRERAVLDREVTALERDRALLERERAMMERERAAMERERAVMEREKLMMEKDRDTVRTERLTLEQEKARLERQFPQKEGTEDGSNVKDSDVMDRKERLLYLFEKLVQNF